MCVFQSKFNLCRDSYLMDTSSPVSTTKYICTFLFVVCVTFFTRPFNIYWKTRKPLLAVQITKHLIVQTPPVLF